MRPLVVKGRAARLGRADASDPVSPTVPMRRSKRMSSQVRRAVEVGFEPASTACFAAGHSVGAGDGSVRFLGRRWGWQDFSPRVPKLSPRPGTFWASPTSVDIDRPLTTCRVSAVGGQLTRRHQLQRTGSQRHVWHGDAHASRSCRFGWPGAVGAGGHRAGDGQDQRHYPLAQVARPLARAGQGRRTVASLEAHDHRSVGRGSQVVGVAA